MPFSEEALADLAREYRQIDRRCNKLLLAFVYKRYQNDKAREYAQHGFSRRLQTLQRCIERVFELLPPESGGLPSKPVLTDATINVQAFVFNAFGALDNLAWIWVSERGLTRPNGSPLSPSQIGLGPGATFVRQSFSAEFRDYLEGMAEWFEHLEDFRHALAHRIPIYIPPYSVPERHVTAYRDLEERAFAASLRGDWEEHDRLEQEQRALVTFLPWMQHSLYGNRPPIVFHAQLIADFKAVEEIGWKVKAELDRQLII